MFTVQLKCYTHSAVHYLLGIFLAIPVAVVLGGASWPTGTGGFDIAKNLIPSSKNTSCLTPGCSSLNITCPVIRFQIKMFPLSEDIMNLKNKLCSYLLKIIRYKVSNFKSSYSKITK